jgi:hypothetical protein
MLIPNGASEKASLARSLPTDLPACRRSPAICRTISFQRECLSRRFGKTSHSLGNDRPTALAAHVVPSASAGTYPSSQGEHALGEKNEFFSRHRSSLGRKEGHALVVDTTNRQEATRFDRAGNSIDLSLALAISFCPNTRLR